MNFLTINCSPKGQNSITLQTSLFFKIKYQNHNFDFFDAGVKIKSLENDLTPLIEKINAADCIIFSYPVYTFIAPYQLHRLIELLKGIKLDLSDKYVTQISTSKHFYDWTASEFIKENVLDFNGKYIKGLCLDMDDLTKPSGRVNIEKFFDQLCFNIENQIFEKRLDKEINEIATLNKNVILSKKEKGLYDVLILSCHDSKDINTIYMIEKFKDLFPYEVRHININEYNFHGGCLGCFSCAISGKCIYKDGFDSFLRTQIQNADSIVYAFPIINHFTHSKMKAYDDRQFCNGHRQVIEGTPIGYLISGHLSNEYNLKTIIEGRCEVGGTYLSGIVCDEQDNVDEQIQKLCKNIIFALEHNMNRPKNFLGVGGTLIFRDLIYEMRGLMKADHKFYKKTGIYNTFPQKHRKRILLMKLVGCFMAVPSIQKKMKNQMNKFILKPYKDVLKKEKAKCQKQ